MRKIANVLLDMSSADRGDVSFSKNGDNMLFVFNNKCEQSDVKNTSSKHYIKSSFLFESIVDSNFNIYDSEDYTTTKFIDLATPFVKLRYSGKNLIKSYPRAGRDFTERKIISRKREYFYWNDNLKELIPCDKKLLNIIVGHMFQKYIEQYNKIPDNIKKTKEYKNGKIQYTLTTRQGNILIRR